MNTIISTIVAIAVAVGANGTGYDIWDYQAPADQPTPIVQTRHVEAAPNTDGLCLHVHVNEPDDMVQFTASYTFNGEAIANAELEAHPDFFGHGMIGPFLIVEWVPANMELADMSPTVTSIDLSGRSDVKVCR